MAGSYTRQDAKRTASEAVLGACAPLAAAGTLS